MELELHNSCIGISTTTTTSYHYSSIIAATAAVFIAVYFVFRRLSHGYHLRAITFKDAPTTKEVYCAICLHNLAGGDRYRKLPKCNHCFHVACIDPWFENRPTCPLCRSHVHHLPSSKHRKNSPPSKFSYFLLFSRHILKMMGSFVIDGISKAF